jgi:hypothetical protein
MHKFYPMAELFSFPAAWNVTPCPQRRNIRLVNGHISLLAWPLAPI